MLKLGFISQQEYSAAREKPVSIIELEKNILGSHIKETMRLFLEDTFGKKKLYTGGLKIQTTINSHMQHHAEKVFKRMFKSLHETYSDELDGALVCIEGSTGAIKALVGGYNFSTSQFNRALQANRQMGSTFKSLVYAHALTQGKTFTDTAIDEPFILQQGGKEWAPSNADHSFKGPMTLAYALSRSNNIVTIKTFLEAGPQGVVELAKACNLSPGHAYPSLALGCIEATPLETVAMMNIFAQQGRYAKPYSIVSVKDEWGTKLYKAGPQRKQVLAPEISSQVAKVLTLRIEQARKKSPQLWCPCDALGKSGTTNDARTCWFVGSTPRYTTGVYVGYDDNRSLGRWAMGSRTAFPVWREFNWAIDQPEESFKYDSQLEEITIHSISGEPCPQKDPQAITILVPATQTST